MWTCPGAMYMYKIRKKNVENYSSKRYSWNLQQYKRNLLTFLLHKIRTTGMKHSWKFPASRGIRSRPVRLKRQYYNHWAKESTPWRRCQRLKLYLLAVRILPRHIIEGRSSRPEHSPFSRKSSFMMTQSHFQRSKILSRTSSHLTTWNS